MRAPGWVGLQRAPCDEPGMTEPGMTEVCCWICLGRAGGLARPREECPIHGVNALPPLPPSTRPWPASFDRYYRIAVKAGLPSPIGRALYACNRHQNGWPFDGFARIEPDYLMRRAKAQTADRWYDHWMAGGSIKSLGKRSTLIQEPLPTHRRAINLTGRI